MLSTARGKAALACWALALQAVPARAADPGTTTPAASEEVLIWDGKAMPAIIAGQASDPAMFHSGNQWATFFTTIGWKPSCSVPDHYQYQYVVQQARATLPVGAGLTSQPGDWGISPDGAGSYLQPVSLGGSGAWDEHGVETPKVVTGYDPSQGRTVTRLYYTGWRRVRTGTDAAGCPIFGYTDWKIGMAEWNAACNCWVKRPTPVLEPGNVWERTHYRLPNGTLVTYGFIGDQSVLYVPGPGGAPGLWHMYYQANTDSPSLRVVTIHAISADGVNWPAAGRSILNTRRPYANAILPGGPYHLDVTAINGRYYFAGWIPGSADLRNQGLWVVSSTTPDGSAQGDFTDWRPLLYDSNGTWWHDPGPDPTSHEAGLFAPTLVPEGNSLWLFYSGIRKDADGIWVSIGRASVSTSILH